MGESTPTTLAEFTPAWLTEALRAGGTITETSTVTAIEQEILGQGEGFMGDLARLTLGYEGGNGPATVIAKIPTHVDLNRATGRALGVYEREARIYAEILPTIDIPKPTVHTALYEAAGDEHELLDTMRKAQRLPLWLLRLLVRREQQNADVPPCVLLIEDLATAHVGDQVAGADPERIEAGLVVLARIHAATWARRGLPDTHWLQSAGVIPRIFHAMYLNGRRTFERDLREVMSARSRAIVKGIRRDALARTRRLHEQTPNCLLHGDYRLDNLFFDDDGEVAAVIDWQAANPGPGVLDVAYFVVSSLHASVPESTVDDLLGSYHATLVGAGVEGYGLDRCRADYVEALLVLVHRMPALTGSIDLGDGRGQQLIDTWLERLDVRLQRVPA